MKPVLGVTAMQKLLGKSRFDELLSAFVEKPQGKTYAAAGVRINAQRYQRHNLILKKMKEKFKCLQSSPIP